MLENAVGTEDVVAIETTLDSVAIAMATEHAVRGARRAVGARRSARRNVTNLSTGAVGENIDRVGRIHVVVAELQDVVRSAAVIRIQNAGEEAVSVHRVVVASAWEREKK